MRLEKQLSAEHVANEAEWSISKLVRIENGQVGISKSDLTALLTLYGITDKSSIDELQELARASRQRMWWSQYQRHLPSTLLEFIGAEFDATRILYCQPLVVPSVLQTRAYAEAINKATTLGPMTPDLATARVDVRLRRQREMLQRGEAREIVAIVDEAVLRRPVGGDEAARDQLDHIANLAESDLVSLVVLPFAVGPHLGMIGPFTLLGYPDPQDNDVVYLENAVGGLILRDQAATVAMYRASADRLIEMGLRDKAAAEFVRRIRKDLL